MSDQLDLLSYAPVHAGDGVESRIAASRVQASRQYRQVLEALYVLGEATDDQLADRCGLLRHAAGTRRGVACKNGLVERAGRGMTPRGNPAATWRLTAEGRQFVEQLGDAA